MPSHFPGMDPYNSSWGPTLLTPGLTSFALHSGRGLNLGRSDLGDFHHNLTSAILVPSYYVAVKTHVT